MITLYNDELSGNCYKVRLLLSLLSLEHELEPINLQQGEQKALAFLALNPFGQVPVLTDGNVVIRDAQAILVYLARRYGSEDWLPIEAEPMSKVLQWLSTTANEIQHSFAAARKYFLFNQNTNLDLVHQQAHRLLQVFDQHLQGRTWLELNRPTIADVACFPYVGLAADGKISLDDYPHVVAWTEQVKQLPGYVGMPGL